MLFAQATEANGTLGGAGLAYSGGFWQGFSIAGGCGLAVLLTGMFYAKPLNRMNLITLPDFYYRRYNNTVEILVSILSTITFIIMLAGNIAGSGWILQWVFGISLIQAMLIVTSIVFLYTILGGIFSCVVTDIIQLYPAVIAFVGSAIYLISANGGWAAIASNIPANYIDMSGITSIENGAITFWASFLTMGIGAIISLDFMERVFCAKSPEAASYGCYWGAVFTFIMAATSATLGLIGLSIFPDVEMTNDIIPLLATESVPFLLGLFVLSGIIGAGLSTANGGLLAVSAVFARNILQRNLLKTKRQEMSEEEKVKFDMWLLKATRLISIPVMSASLILALIKPEPGVMLVLAFEVVFSSCLVPLTLGLFWQKANTPGALAAIIGGGISRIILYFIMPSNLVGLDTLLAPIISLICMVIVSLLTQVNFKSKHSVIYQSPSDDVVLSGEM